MPRHFKTGILFEKLSIILSFTKYTKPTLPKFHKENYKEEKSLFSVQGIKDQYEIGRPQNRQYFIPTHTKANSRSIQSAHFAKENKTLALILFKNANTTTRVIYAEITARRPFVFLFKCCATQREIHTNFIIKLTHVIAIPIHV